MGDGEMNFNLLVVAFGAAFVLFAVIFGLRFVYDYRIENRAIEIVLFHLVPIYRLPFEDIELIRKTSWSELGVGGITIRFGNRFAGQCVLIQKRNGWFRRIVITPNNADEFIGQVQAGQQL